MEQINEVEISLLVIVYYDINVSIDGEYAFPVFKKSKFRIDSEPY